MTVETVLVHGMCAEGTLYSDGGSPRCTVCGTEDVPMWHEFQPDPGVTITTNSTGDVVAREEL